MPVHAAAGGLSDPRVEDRTSFNLPRCRNLIAVDDPKTVVIIDTGV
jgi:hypothetical protein